MKYHLIFLVLIFSCLLTSAQQSSANEMQMDTSRPYALIAGGSKGIGYGIAEALAKRNYNLILIARHLDTLQAAKNKLETKYKVHVEILAMDLSFDTTATEI